MTPRALSRFLPAFVSLCLPAFSGGADWSQWRGPAGTGVASESAPTTWSDTENVKWKAEIPGRGVSTPVAWGDRLFVTTAVPIRGEEAKPSDEEGQADEKDQFALRPPQGQDGGMQGRRRRGGMRGDDGPPPPQLVHDFTVLCLDRKSGDILWKKVLRREKPNEGFHKQYGSHASHSPVVEDGRLYVSFGSRGLYCLDHDGKLIWEVDYGVTMTMRRAFGEGGSPLLYEGKIVQVMDQEGDSFIVCVDKDTGEVSWRHDRDEPSGWSQPIGIEVDGQHQVIASGTNRVRGYDLKTGEVVWECGGLGLNAIPVPVLQDDHVIVMTGFRGANMMSIQFTEEGDLTDSEAVAWTSQKGASYTPSPVLHDGRLYCLMDRGFLSCFDAKTGDPHYLETRLPRGSNYKASPVAAGDKLYVAGESGEVHVIAMGDEYKLLHTNTLEGEFFVSSPIVAGGDLFLRGLTHLICISED